MEKKHINPIANHNGLVNTAALLNTEAWNSQFQCQDPYTYLQLYKIYCLFINSEGTRNW